jgi:hypothetical protein
MAPLRKVLRENSIKASSNYRTRSTALRTLVN